jgi:hypothetical protein
VPSGEDDKKPSRETKQHLFVDTAAVSQPVAVGKIQVRSQAGSMQGNTAPSPRKLITEK